MPVTLLLVVAALVANGCASRGSARELHEQVSAIRVAVATLQEDLESAGSVRDDLQVLTARIAGLESRLSEASAQVGRLDARVAGVEKQATAALQKVETLETAVEKVSVAASPPPPPSALPRPPAPEGAPPGRTTVPPPVTPRASEPSSGLSSPGSRRADLEFGAALTTFRSGEHGQAVLELMDFLARHPKHPQGGNAQYWIGEAYFLQRDYRQSIVEFEKVLEHGLSHPSVPDALYRIGLANRSLKDRASAVEVWRRLVRDYPKSSAAARARESLQAAAPDGGRR